MTPLLYKADEIFTGAFMEPTKIARANLLRGVIPKGGVGGTSFEDAI
jgi:hypothetical protein